jgi:hypothetical protein
MFAPQSSPVGRFEGQSPKTKDVMFCERSAFPLAVPSALVAAIWDQVNEGLRAVPRGGAEIGGLLLGRQSQTTIVLAEEVVPIKIEYRLGPSFRLSDVDVNGLRSLMASVQKDPSKAVVGFYRSRTRNDSHSQEGDSELLAVLEQAHTSFAANFHYYIAFTPLSRLSMTASVSVRKDDGWDDWQHVTLRSNPMSSVEPIEFEAPPKEPPPPPAPVLEQPQTRPPAPLPAAHAEPLPHPYQEQHYAPPPEKPAVRAPTRSEHRPPHQDWMSAASPEQRRARRNVPTTWYIGGGGVLLAAIAVGAYLFFASPSQPRITFSDAAVSAATSSVRTGFSAAREGALWRLTWDRAAVAALNPTGAVLAIRDGGKEQQVGLTASDLSSGTILYTPQSSDLLFSLNIVMAGSQVAEEHVRVLGALPAAEPPSARDLAEPVKIVVHEQVRTLRPFTPATNAPGDFSSVKSAAAEIPPPPSIAAASPVNSTIPILPPPTSVAAPVPANPTPPPATPAPSAPVTVDPKVVRRVSPNFSGPLPSGTGATVQIRVQIDAAGKVIKVTPITSNAYVDIRLVQAAAAAAKSWVFDPATIDGRPVPSERILDFHFGDK